MLDFYGKTINGWYGIYHFRFLYIHLPSLSTVPHIHVILHMLLYFCPYPLWVKLPYPKSFRVGT